MPWEACPHCVCVSMHAPQDIKPKNVFLTSKDCVRIGDLGCSKVMKQSLARTQIGKGALGTHCDHIHPQHDPLPPSLA